MHAHPKCWDAIFDMRKIVYLIHGVIVNELFGVKDAL